MKSLINAGIKGIFFMDGEVNDDVRKLLKEAKVTAEMYQVGGQ